MIRQPDKIPAPKPARSAYRTSLIRVYNADIAFALRATLRAALRASRLTGKAIRHGL